MTQPSDHRSVRVVDLCAGPGGWEIGAFGHGIVPLGIEWDDSACATRDAAGLLTLKANVAELDPQSVTRMFVNGGPSSRIEGLIASPPCQAWSMAGKGGGRRDQEHV